MSPIRVAIVEDHQSIIDGYLYRLAGTQIEIVAVVRYGEEIEKALTAHQVDVLLLDVHVPTSAENSNPFPVLYLIPRLLSLHPGLKILVISMLNQRSLIEALVDCGIHGYIFKADYNSIEKLGDVVEAVAKGGVYFSQEAYQSLLVGRKNPLTHRQMEALSLCITYPDVAITILARKMSIKPSTYRNLLSGAYKRLGVQTRMAAIQKAHQLGILPPTSIRLATAAEENTAVT